MELKQAPGMINWLPSWKWATCSTTMLNKASNWQIVAHIAFLVLYEYFWLFEISDISEIWDNRKEQLSVNKAWESVLAGSPHGRTQGSLLLVTILTWLWHHYISWIDFLSTTATLGTAVLYTHHLDFTEPFKLVKKWTRKICDPDTRIDTTLSIELRYAQLIKAPT